MITYNPKAIEYLKEDLTKIIPEKVKDMDITSLSYLEEAVSSLDTIKQIIIERKYGGYSKPLKLEDIGEGLGIAEERVRQVEKKALNQLLNYSLREAWETKYGKNNPEMPIEISELSYKIKKVCKWEKIETMEELSKLSRKEIINKKGINVVSLKEIEDYLLNQFGIKLS